MSVASSAARNPKAEKAIRSREAAQVDNDDNDDPLAQRPTYHDQTLQADHVLNGEKKIPVDGHESVMTDPLAAETKNPTSAHVDVGDDNLQEEEEEEQQQQQQQQAKIPLQTLLALCLCMISYSYLVISVFPYAAFMVVNLVDAANQDNAGSYAGLLASLFHFGILMTAVKWGFAADTYGRIAVLKASLGLSAFFSLLFGFAPTYGFALAVRFCLGASSAIVGTVKTLVSDLSQGNEREQARVMSLVLGMWGMGFLIGPLMSGQVADPVKQYRDWEFWESHPGITSFLERFPFLLPNMIGVCFCLVAIFLIHHLIPETMVDHGGGLTALCSDAFAYIRSCFGATQRYQALSLDRTEDGSANATDEESQEPDGIMAQDDEEAVRGRRRLSMKQLFSHPQTRSCMLVLWGNSFVWLASAEMVPLFFVSPSSGFGFTESKIGQILSISGLFFIGAQLCGMQGFVYNRLGLYGSIRLGAALLPLTFAIVPASLLLNHGYDEGSISTASLTYLIVVFTINKCLFLVFFANISVAINRSAPTGSLASLNGLSVFGSSVSRGMGPTFSGVVATVSVAWLGRYGSLLMFGSLTLISCFVAIAAFVFMKEEDRAENEESLVEMTEESGCDRKGMT